VSRSRPDQEEAEQALRTLIAYIGDDPDRPGVLDTPGRVLRAWREDWGAGYTPRTPADLLRMFENEEVRSPRYTYSQMVMVRRIAFFSHCEHHLAPFFGTATIGYIPNSLGIVGISKLARVTEYFSRRLQVQERLTWQIADFLRENLSPDVAVTMEATHLCMVSRGARQPNAATRTTSLAGEFLDDATARAEFLQAAYAPA